MMRLHEALRIKKGLPPDSLHDMLFSRKLLGIPEKTSTVTGYPCVLENSVGKPVLSYKISGNIVQNGTPSPDAPVEVQGVGQLVTEGEHSGEYEISVVSRGKNLLKFYTYDKVLTYGGLTITIENNGIITINGRIVFSNIWVEIGYKFGGGTDYQYTPIISLSPNTDYTLSSKVISGTCSEQRQFSLGGYLDGTTQVQNFICKFGTASTFNSGAFLFDRIFLSLGSYGTIYDNYRIQLQLELGTTATPYEPYHEPITTSIYLNEPLYKGDYINKDKSGDKVYRTWGVKILNGTELWTKDSNENDKDNDYFYIRLPNAQLTGEILVSHFNFSESLAGLGNYWAFTTVFVISIVKSLTEIVANDNKATRIAKFKS